jgi:hypothetical protein
MIGRVLAAALLALAATAAWAQNALIAEDRWIVRQLDVDSTSVNYFATAFPLRKAVNRVATSGSSTTVSAVVAGSGPFAPVVAPGAGSQDWVAFVAPAQPVATEAFRIVAAKASNDQITVNSAIDLSAGYDAYLGLQRGGAAVTDGWLDLSGWRAVAFTVQYAQGDLTGGLDWRLECKGGLSAAIVEPVYPTEGNDDCGTDGVTASGYCRFATAPASFTVGIDFTQLPFGYCRVGTKVATADPSDAGANLEQVNVTIRGVK